MKKRRIRILLLVLPAIAWLFWPLGSDHWKININEQELKEKQVYFETYQEKSKDPRPNILLITVDDLGMADCSLYGEGDIQTPQIDRLGKEGIVFENAYVTSPVCAPSRAALMTGRYQHRFGFEYTMHDRYLRNRLEYFGFRFFVNSYPWKAKWANKVPDGEAVHQQGLPVSEITLAEVLKKAGYNTGIVGKWHLGWSKEKRPSEFGFDEQYGFFHSHSLYAPEGTPGIVDQKIENDWTDPHIWSGQRDGAHAIHRNYKEIEENEFLTDRITEESIAYIEQHKSAPFFLWISYNAPHTPLQAPKEYVDQYQHIEDPVKRVYRAMIHNLDDNLGYLMDYLNEAQLDTNTLVFFLSDNGGAEYTHTTDNGRYEGGKNTEFEGGIKVPMIVRWTGTLPAGKRFKPMVSSLDVFPSSIHAAGTNIPMNRPIDGTDLLPYLLDSVPGTPHEHLFWKRGQSKVVRTDEWKLVINGNSVDTLLYNLVRNRYEDPDESDTYPDIVSRLSQRHMEWLEMHRPPMWPPVVFFIGKKGEKEYYFDQ
jgi:arylsulfatase A-like enzyme